MKTAKEIFDEYCDNTTRYLNEPEALQAMEEYASQSSHPAHGMSGITVKDFEKAIMAAFTFESNDDTPVETFYKGRAAHDCYDLAMKMQGSQVDCEHPYAFVDRTVDYEKCAKCGKVLCEG